MKEIIIMVAAILMSVSVNANSNIVDSITKTPHRVEPFTEVNVNVPARVRVIQGKEYGVMAQTAELVDSSKLDYKVKNGVLYISTNCTDMLNASGRGTVITVITPANEAKVSTGSNVQTLRNRK